MYDLFILFFYQPLLNLLIFIYNSLPGHDLGIAIVVLTIVVKALLFPLSWKQIKAQAEMQKMQPLIAELKEKHKDDKQALMQAQVALFKEHNVNPLASCLPLLIQLPFLIALFYVFQNGIQAKDLNLLYSFVANPGTLNHTFLGWFSVTQNHNIVIAVITGALQFIQTKMMMPAMPKPQKGKEEEFATIMNKQMLYMMPVLTGFISYQFPSGLGLYWSVQTLLGIAQQLFFFKKKSA
ncbi:membrane protein insertase YidC [Candidatus Uhrbacteria bacterium]|nr:membrane protein insertase YidC [Candidatus Uhrbacteria bacterium]